MGKIISLKGTVKLGMKKSFGKKNKDTKNKETK